MLLQDLQNLCLSWLDDLNATYFTLTQLNVFINNAQREAQKQLLQAGQNWYMTSAYTYTVALQNCYTLPSDFLKLHKFDVYTQGDPGLPQSQSSLNTLSTLQYITPTEVNLVSQGPGCPTCYYFEKNCIVLTAVPDQVYPIQMLYTPIVSDMTNQTQAPDVPLQYHEYIAILATIDGLLKDQRDPTAFLEKKRYYEELMRQDAVERNLDSPRMIVTTESDGFSYFF